MTTKDSKFITPFALIALMGTSIALASPEGGDVVEGDATIEYDGDWTRVLTGEITIIDWLNFNIAQGETVEFIMPSEASRVLNRITSGVPTEIMGNLIGNGQVFIVNPSGVIFGQNAVVNVGALYAAAGNISNADFMAGTYRFTDARGIVENRGHLQGDLIALVGGRVANHGTISASNGTVVLAAGEQVLIGELLGHTFVRLERPTDLDNTPTLDTNGAPSLAAGDVYSLAAWNTGIIDGKDTTIAVSAGHMQIDADITAGELSLLAEGDSHIQLGADLHAYGPGVVITGDLILTDDVSVTTDGSVIAFKGAVDSEEGMQHDLFVDADGGAVRFTEHVGSLGRLGSLEIHAGTTRFFGDVSVNNQLNLYTPVSISGPSTIFDVGMGSALFADVVYSSRHGRSDIQFLYDGEAWVGQGQARAPYQFRAGIGTNGTDIRAFRNIVFGGDLSDPSRSSAFVFATGANAGLDLIDPSTDLGFLFEVLATESITMGQGQKITSLGSLTLQAESDGFTSIAVGDLNVLGDLRVASLGRSGGQVIFNTRAPGEVDWFGNEDDRETNALIDEGLELIASGDITIIGAFGGDGPARIGSGGSVTLLNNSGNGTTPGLGIEVFEGGVSLDLFASMIPSASGFLYPYDLTIIPQSTNPGTQANLASALDEEAPINLRNDDPLNAAREILAELGFTPNDQQIESIRASHTTGVDIHADGGARESNTAASFGLTLDRLTRASVQRLTYTYINALGIDADQDGLRDRIPELAKALVFMELNDKDPELNSANEFIVKHASQDLELVKHLIALQSVMNAIDLLELTPHEIEHAKKQLLNRLVPNALDPDHVYQRWYAPRASRIAISRD